MNVKICAVLLLALAPMLAAQPLTTKTHVRKRAKKGAPSVAGSHARALPASAAAAKRSAVRPATHVNGLLRTTRVSYTAAHRRQRALPIFSPARHGFTLTARVENALNKRYEDALHFAAPGRTILIGARASTIF